MANSFPWHIGVFDAHCHPTDTLQNLPDIPSMKAKVLTVMATRAQDQDLVATAADDMGVAETDVRNTAEEWRQDHKVLPCFGWHPWFSHQMFLPGSGSGSVSDETESLSKEEKIAHYKSTLTPSPTEEAFVSALPEPQPFATFLAQTKQYLERYPLALIGEVGLDKSFRIPEDWLPGEKDQRDDSLTEGGREGRRLSPYRVSMDHQKKILLAQLRLAGEMGRAVSCHGVAAHGVLFDTLSTTWKGHELKVKSKRERKREQAQGIGDEADSEERRQLDTRKPGGMPYPPRLCLHSFSGPAEQVKMYCSPAIPCDIFFSFSSAINFSPLADFQSSGRSAEEAKSQWEEANKKPIDSIKAVPTDKILVESDLHIAGDRMDGYLEEIVRWICDIKGWDLEKGVKTLGDNWRRFVFERGSN